MRITAAVLSTPPDIAIKARFLIGSLTGKAYHKGANIISLRFMRGVILKFMVLLIMNETLKTIMERYSCRDFTVTPLDSAQLKTLVEAALASPSGMNRQPWHVIVITDIKLIEELDAEGMTILAAAYDKSGYERIMSRGGKLFYNAPCMIIAATSRLSPAAMDCGILSENVALAAHSLGLGSVICGMASIPFSGSKGDDFKKRLKFPDGYDFSIAVLVGTAKSTKEPHELDMTKVTYIEP